MILTKIAKRFLQSQTSPTLAHVNYIKPISFPVAHCPPVALLPRAFEQLLSPLLVQSSSFHHQISSQEKSAKITESDSSMFHFKNHKDQE